MDKKLLPFLGGSFYYVNPQERKPQAQRDWLDLLQGRAHNVHEVDEIPKSASRRRSVIGRKSSKGGRTMSTKWTLVHVAL